MIGVCTHARLQGMGGCAMQSSMLVSRGKHVLEICIRDQVKLELLFVNTCITRCLTNLAILVESRCSRYILKHRIACYYQTNVIVISIMNMNRTCRSIFKQYCANQ